MKKNEFTLNELMGPESVSLASVEAALETYIYNQRARAETENGRLDCFLTNATDENISSAESALVNIRKGKPLHRGEVKTLMFAMEECFPNGDPKKALLNAMYQNFDK